jgi:hypothetical protein
MYFLRVLSCVRASIKPTDCYELEEKGPEQAKNGALKAGSTGKVFVCEDVRTVSEDECSVHSIKELRFVDIDVQ